MTTTEFLDPPAGRMAYELTGDPAGPLVVCVPGMGDLRSTYRGLAERLAADGARVASVDGVGHYPQAEAVGEVAPAVADLVRKVA